MKSKRDWGLSKKLKIMFGALTLPKFWNVFTVPVPIIKAVLLSTRRCV